MPSRKFRFDERAGRYRDEKGRFLPKTEPRKALDSAIDSANKRIQELAFNLRDGKIDPVTWEIRMRGEIKNLHLQAAAAARGGWERMGPEQFGRVGPTLRAQYRYLSKFGAGIRSGKVPIGDGRFPARARMYAEAARQTYHDFDEREEIANGMSQERNILGVADHCDQCREQAGLGWVPIGTLIPIGARQCLSFCRCHVIYRELPDKQRQALGEFTNEDLAQRWQAGVSISQLARETELSRTTVRKRIREFVGGKAEYDKIAKARGVSYSMSAPDAPPTVVKIAKGHNQFHYPDGDVYEIKWDKSGWLVYAPGKTVPLNAAKAKNVAEAQNYADLHRVAKKAHVPPPPPPPPAPPPPASPLPPPALPANAVITKIKQGHNVVKVGSHEFDAHWETSKWVVYDVNGKKLGTAKNLKEVEALAKGAAGVPPAAVPIATDIVDFGNLSAAKIQELKNQADNAWAVYGAGEVGQAHKEIAFKKAWLEYRLANPGAPNYKVGSHAWDSVSKLPATPVPASGGITFKFPDKPNLLTLEAKVADRVANGLPGYTPQLAKERLTQLGVQKIEIDQITADAATALVEEFEYFQATFPKAAARIRHITTKGIANPDKSLASANVSGVLRLNPKFFGDNELYKKTFQNSQASPPGVPPWHPRYRAGTSPWRTDIAHEMGHFIDYEHGTESLDAGFGKPNKVGGTLIQKWKDKWWPDAGKLSQYAATNHKELLAEAYTGVLYGTDILLSKPMIKELEGILAEISKQSGGTKVFETAAMKAAREAAEKAAKEAAEKAAREAAERAAQAEAKRRAAELAARRAAGGGHVDPRARELLAEVGLTDDQVRKLREAMITGADLQGYGYQAIDDKRRKYIGEVLQSRGYTAAQADKAYRNFERAMDDWVGSSSSDGALLMKKAVTNIDAEGEITYHGQYVDHDAALLQSLDKRTSDLLNGWGATLQELSDVAAAEAEFARAIWEKALGPGKKLRVYRGVRDDFFRTTGMRQAQGTEIMDTAVAMNSVSSWTTRRAKAVGFGKNVFVTDIDPEDMWTDFATNRSLRNFGEWEVILRGKMRGAKLVDAKELDQHIKDIADRAEAQAVGFGARKTPDQLREMLKEIEDNYDAWVDYGPFDAKATLDKAKKNLRKLLGI